ncbi:ABC transporter ATP-binding protein [Candidatus Methylocalor cossyra]|uniref:ABC transporter ATP-binding protein n=1 Tax=Candidatus Methylocalor cossyra TaxID=3108543 RepID=UPI0032B26E40
MAGVSPEGREHLRVTGLTLAYGDFLVLRDIDFTVGRGEIFIIMGGSGSGKSTLLRPLIGLQPPAAGTVRFAGEDLWQLAPAQRDRLLRRMGILYQGGALWSAMTLAENVALPLALNTRLAPGEIAELVSLKLALVGLAGFESFYPAELSGGMQKRAALARALALDPEILFFDEPSAGLDPVSARRLDELILHLRDSLGSTVVIVTHDLASILDIGTDSIFLDAESKTIIARGPPRELLAHCPQPRVREFLTRGGASPP